MAGCCGFTFPLNHTYSNRIIRYPAPLTSQCNQMLEYPLVKPLLIREAQTC